MFHRCAAAVLLAAWTCPVGAGAARAGGVEDLARPWEGRSMRSSSTMRQGEVRRGDGGSKLDPKAAPRGDGSEESNFDNYNVPPGATHVLLDEKGPGVITHLWMTFLGPEPQPWAKKGSANHQEMLLRAFWDGRERPAVEAPVGDFFANCFGQRSEVVSLPVVVEDADSYNCFWTMPFRKSARIEIENQGDRPISLLYYNIDWIRKDRLPDDTPYFHAQYRQEHPCEPGRDYVVLETEGRGHYVGTVLGVRTRSPAWFGEGDEKISIDGEAVPSIWGTGTEDYFLSAWGLKTTHTPFAGVPCFDGWGILGGRTSAYRWHIHDPVVFQRGIRVAFEHWGWIPPDENPDHRATSWNERADDYCSVAFWYQTGIPTFAARAPHARERRLPSLDRVVVFARDAADGGQHGDGVVVKQSLEFHDGAQLFYRAPSATNAWVEIPLSVTNREPLRLLIRATTAPDDGRDQAMLDGVKLGAPLDFYSADLAGREFHLLDFWPEPGAHTLRLECVGRNAQSTGHFCGIESVRLRERRPKVKEFGFDKDEDWRRSPRLPAEGR